MKTYQMIMRLRWMTLLASVGLLAQCESREQRMLFEAAERTGRDNPTAGFTKEAYLLTIRFRPGTQLAKEAQAKVDEIDEKNMER